jgi:O-antigen ligase
MLYGTQVLGHPLLVRDLLELPKPWIPVLFFTLALEADLTEESLRALLATLLPATVIICVYAYGQWLNMGFTYYLQPLYSGGLHDDGGLAHYRRVYSTLSNPNTLGILMTWLIAAFAMAALFRVGSRFWNVTLLFASLVTVAMTGSRYGLIDTVIALLLIFALPSPAKWLKRRRRAVLMLALPLLLGVILWVSATNSATFDRYAMLGTPLQENSLRLRLDGLWRDAFDYFLRSPLLGHGPARIVFGDIYTDSEYLQILKQYGLLGLVPYLCYFLVPLAMIRSGLKHVNKAGQRLQSQWLATYWAVCLGFIMTVTALVMNIGMGSYYDQSLVAFLWMWMGIAASCARRITDLTQNKLSYGMLMSLKR